MRITVGAQRVLVRHGLVAVPDTAGAAACDESLATVAANIAHYGYALSARAFAALRRVDEDGLAHWWGEVEPVLAVLTGDDRGMDRFVVYKNFPAEVLALTEAEYWLRQILMYWGLPDEYVTEPEAPRPALSEAPAPRVLHLADDGAPARILADLFAVPARWTEDQWQDVEFLVPDAVDLSGIPFVENRIRLAALSCARGTVSTVDNATDVLRLAAALSDGDVSLREPARLRRFARRERRFLLTMLESATHLAEDVARRREPFKRLLRVLHPGERPDAYPRTVAVYDALYKGAPLPSFASDVERLLTEEDPAVLSLLATRPGEFARRLRVLAVLFGDRTAEAFEGVAGRLTTIQLLKLRGFLRTVHSRRWRMFPPRGNWNRVVVVPAVWRGHVPRTTRTALLETIARELTARTEKVGPVALAAETRHVKLPTNDAELAPYGRGTVFPIPDGVRFLRTAVYWSSGPTRHNIWYDNGWNFFGADWQPRGACCWSATMYPGGKKSSQGAVFSGDPTNSKDASGRACQLIDLYPDRLHEKGVRYAVWSVLCYSRIMFSEAEEVFAALQWGERAEEGALFEPSRCQLAFPLTGEAYTKFVAYVDLRRRELVYRDANLPVRVESAAANGKRLATTMPAFVEYLETLPSVYDLFRHAPADEAGMPVLYDDAAVRIDGGPAYVFRPSNRDNNFAPLDPVTLL
ncbi:hypothetical protein Val02_23650 [Virgisporangium aliadipatigenens]|uniref:Cytoplasmic protein n=1 Tax=Virgisporangium aliadipatigenens TaxID=741659 RepID=A0A8J3YHP3_9ACTN|nr:hypothetical protein [Virgisporangium aliadipatigenens]GIJ45479.1 hypothetical protein Val02_23650 [Virgisporangium aliadipatigenens]